MGKDSQYSIVILLLETDPWPLSGSMLIDLEKTGRHEMP